MLPQAVSFVSSANKSLANIRLSIPRNAEQAADYLVEVGQRLVPLDSFREQVKSDLKA
jgi:hypothetical protein